MQEAEGLLLCFRQRAPILARGFEQNERTDHIGLNKICRAVDGAVYVTLGGKVQNGAGLVLREQFVHGRAVANVGTRKHMTGVALERLKRSEVPRIRQLIDVQNGFVRAI